MVPPEPGLSPRCGAAVYQGAPFCIRCGQAPVWHSASRRHQRGVLATVFGSLAQLIAWILIAGLVFGCIVLSVLGIYGP
jgi:hypothetical protein